MIAKQAAKEDKRRRRDEEEMKAKAAKQQMAAAEQAAIDKIQESKYVLHLFLFTTLCFYFHKFVFSFTFLFLCSHLCFAYHFYIYRSGEDDFVECPLCELKMCSFPKITCESLNASCKRCLHEGLCLSILLKICNKICDKNTERVELINGLPHLKYVLPLNCCLCDRLWCFEFL